MKHNYPSSSHTQKQKIVCFRSIMQQRRGTKEGLYGDPVLHQPTSSSQFSQKQIAYKTQIARTKMFNVFSKRKSEDPINDPKIPEDFQTGLKGFSSLAKIDMLGLLERPFSAAALDGDFFGLVNRMGGDQFGDQLIQAFSFEMNRLEKTHSHLGINTLRWGGEEYFLIFESDNTAEISAFLALLSSRLQSIAEELFEKLSSSDFSVKDVFSTLLEKKTSKKNKESFVGSFTMVYAHFKQEDYSRFLQTDGNISYSSAVKNSLDMKLLELKKRQKGACSLVSISFESNETLDSEFLQIIKKDKNKQQNYYTILANIADLQTDLQEKQWKFATQNINPPRFLENDPLYKLYISLPGFSLDLENKLIAKFSKIEDIKTIIQSGRVEYNSATKNKDINFMVDTQHGYSLKKFEDKNESDEYLVEGNGFKIMNTVLGYSMTDAFLQFLSSSLQGELGDSLLSIKKERTQFTILIRKNCDFNCSKWYKDQYDYFIDTLTEGTNCTNPLHKILEISHEGERTKKERDKSPLGECTIKKLS